MVPHISSVFENINQMSTTIERLVHDVGVLNSRMFFHNDSTVASIKEDVNQLKSKFEDVVTKAEWVTHQMRTNDSTTKDAANALDHLNASTVKMSNLLEIQIGLTAAAAPGASFSHPNLWTPPSQPVNSPGFSTRPEGSLFFLPQPAAPLPPSFSSSFFLTFDGEPSGPPTPDLLFDDSYFRVRPHSLPPSLPFPSPSVSPATIGAVPKLAPTEVVPVLIGHSGQATAR